MRIYGGFFRRVGERRERERVESAWRTHKNRKICGGFVGRWRWRWRRCGEDSVVQKPLSRVVVVGDTYTYSHPVRVLWFGNEKKWVESLWGGVVKVPDETQG